MFRFLKTMASSARIEVAFLDADSSSAGTTKGRVGENPHYTLVGENFQRPSISNL
jgi:hypothetical protein